MGSLAKVPTRKFQEMAREGMYMRRGAMVRGKVERTMMHRGIAHRRAMQVRLTSASIERCDSSIF